MSESQPVKSKKGKWPIRSILPFLFISAIGLVPWENIFLIEINDPFILFFASNTIGLISLCVSISILLIYTMLNHERLAGWAMLAVAFLLFPVAGSLFTDLILPPLEWQDISKYCNGKDYLIIQRKQSFVTSSAEVFRLERTAYPTNAIRFLEERITLNETDVRFTKDKITFEGKNWKKLSQ